MKNIVLIDDDPDILRDRTELIKKFGYQCQSFSDCDEAIQLIKTSKPDMILTDLKMPQMSGIDILRQVKNFYPDIIVIIITGYASIQTAIDAIKLGAFDYLVRPVSPQQLKLSIQNAFQRYSIGHKVDLTHDYQEDFPFIIGNSPALKTVLDKVRQAAPTDANIFIFGESGTGKELIARGIHALSKRSNQPFIPLDCIALPFHLMESELFGYEAGAFTGALRSKRGMLEFAQKGTFFLDEIAELNIELQAKLLRMLQERKFRRIGGEKLISIDIRIVSATNKEPLKAIKENKLREDLYYRLNVIPIIVPPLRERKSDIPLLINHFLSQCLKRNQKDHLEISTKAMDALIQYNWPGNVRELQNIVERMGLITEKISIDIDDLPSEILNDGHDLNISQIAPIDNSFFHLPFSLAKQKVMEQFQSQYLRELLKRNKGNISRGAEEAQISRKTIHDLLKALNISANSFK
jgi:two-component system, NtrC family, response regulator AtoC